jgi:hypothetical protein
MTMNFLRKLKLALIGIALLAMAGCSAALLGYHIAPQLSYHWLDGYVDFTAAQRDIVRAELGRIHAWHRQHELPRYVGLLQTLQGLAAGDMNPARACEVAEEVRERYRVLLMQFEPVIVRLAPTATPEQLRHLRHRFDERNRRWRKDWLEGTQTERNEHRLKRLEDRAETFYGSLNHAQEGILEAYVAHSVFDPHFSHAETRRRQDDAIATLDRIGRLAEPDRRREVAAYFERFWRGGDPSYQGYLDRLTAGTCRLIADLHNSATPDQRRRAVKRLGEYLERLQGLRSR